MISAIISGAVNRFTPLGLTLHEVSVGKHGGEAIGVALDGLKHRTTNTIKRFGRIQEAFCDLLDLKRISGWILETVVGHCTYFGLVNRDVLTVFFATYRHIQCHYGDAAPVWKEVRNELVAFRGLMIFVSAKWGWQWT